MDQMTREQFRKLIDSKYAEFLQRSHERVQRNQKIAAQPMPQLRMTKIGPVDYAIRARDVETGLRGGVPSGQNDGIIFAGALTKSVLMALPEASFILSNICHPDATPIFVQRVGEQARRQELWLNLRSLRLQGRGFFVFGTEKSLQAELARRKEAFARHRERHDR